MSPWISGPALVLLISIAVWATVVGFEPLAIACTSPLVAYLLGVLTGGHLDRGQRGE